MLNVTVERSPVNPPEISRIVVTKKGKLVTQLAGMYLFSIETTSSFMVVFFPFAKYYIDFGSALNMAIFKVRSHLFQSKHLRVSRYPYLDFPEALCLKPGR